MPNRRLQHIPRPAEELYEGHRKAMVDLLITSRVLSGWCYAPSRGWLSERSVVKVARWDVA